MHRTSLLPPRRTPIGLLRITSHIIFYLLLFLGRRFTMALVWCRLVVRQLETYRSGNNFCHPCMSRFVVVWWRVSRCRSMTCDGHSVVGCSRLGLTFLFSFFFALLFASLSFCTFVAPKFDWRALDWKRRLNLQWWWLLVKLEISWVNSGKIKDDEQYSCRTIVVFRLSEKLNPTIKKTYCFIHHLFKLFFILWNTQWSGSV